MTKDRLTKTLSNTTIEELQKVAIAYKDNTTAEGIIIADRVNDILISKMECGEFSKFAEKELW